MMKQLSLIGLGLSAAVACAGTEARVAPMPVAERAPHGVAVPITAAQLTEADAPVSEPAVATTRELPSRCDDKGACFPPSAFVDAVCKKKFPELPLYVFAGRMPWQHAYVKAEYVEPVNPYGGDQSEAWLKFGEEVVILRRRGPNGAKGVQISGPSDVDVLRWDGTCATIRQEMLVSYVTAPMESPRIIWKYLGGGLQEALLANKLVTRAREAEKKACRDSSQSHPTPTCDKAMQKLTDAIVLAVHQNVALPAAFSSPEWIE
jgi:hypothetical protein